MKGIDLFAQLRDAGVFVDGVEGLTADQAQAMYMSGAAAIAPLGSWAYTGTDAKLQGTTVLGGLPVRPAARTPSPPRTRARPRPGWWISPNGKKKSDAVEKLVQFMYQPDVLKSMVSGGVVLSTATQVDTSGVTSPLLKQSFTDLPGNVDYTVMPDTYVPGAVSNPMYRATSIAFTKGNDAKKICAAVDDVYKSNS